MVWVKMIETCKGTEDGYVVQEFYSGNNYNISEYLARKFLILQIAENIYIDKN